MPFSERQIALIYMRKKTKSFQNNQNLCIFTNSFSRTASEDLKAECRSRIKEKKKNKLSTCLTTQQCYQTSSSELGMVSEILNSWMNYPVLKEVVFSLFRTEFILYLSYD